MKKIILSFVLGLAIAQLSAQCYSLVWQDDFTGTSLNTNDWNYWIGSAFNNELQYYTDRPENVQVGNGTLKLNALQESYNGYGYTSGRIDTRFKVDFTYGKVEGRMKLMNGQGFWPAFWLLPTGGNWPAGGEIDIMEVLGQTPNKTYGTCHYATTNGSHASLGSSYVLPSGTFADGFHTFAMEWTATNIKWSVDGTVYYTVTKTQVGNSNWPFNAPFYVILNFAVGGDWPGPPNGSTVFPATMEVDWVRIFQTNPNIQLRGKGLCEPNTAGNYSLPAWSGGTYNWSVSSGGTISSGQGTPDLTVNWGAGGDRTVTCAYSNACGAATTSMAVKVSANLWLNNGFESGTVNWNFVKNAPANGSFSVVTSNAAPEGSKTSKVVTSSVSANQWDVQLARNDVAVQKDTSYTFRFWAKASTNGLHTQVNFLNPANFTNYAWQNITLTKTWTLYSLTFIAPYTGNLLFAEDFGFQTGTYNTDNYFFGRTSVALFSAPALARNFEELETVDELDAPGSIFPNPVTDLLYFTAKSAGSFHLLDQLGRLVLEGKVESPGQQVLSVGSLPAGTYFLELNSDNTAREVFRLLKY